jgi:hypothetical protein
VPTCQTARNTRAHSESHHSTWGERRRQIAAAARTMCLLRDHPYVDRTFESPAPHRLALPYLTPAVHSTSSRCEGPAPQSPLHERLTAKASYACADLTSFPIVEAAPGFAVSRRRSMLPNILRSTKPQVFPVVI